ncbi:MAG: alanine--tRNA ligase [Porticoccaceae bacterium]
MNSAAIRQAFLDFFSSRGHQVVASSSLIPGDDPTLLFTNAGMVQFKDVFLGTDKRPYTRAASSQRCVRAGGKHNDLENVGYTARHHTFFEMLGNFSFGDYFKREAIGYAWEFLTQVLQLPPARLWVTVHVSDDDAANIWIKEIGIDPTRFSRLDADNFWQMGDTGPCGPCSEIFYDHGPEIPGGPPGSADDHLDRYIEIWNLVFMQYERGTDGTLTPLPKPSIDTGMGLERIAAVMQGVHSNYEIDLFANLVRAAATVTATTDLADPSLHVIADHIRSATFLVVDGVLPGNEDRGYVLRRIIRRALRHGHRLGANGVFFHRLVPALVAEMGNAYPELAREQDRVEQVLRAEEEQFVRTLDKGMGVLEAALATLEGGEIPGETVFQLYDTYGFPVDLTNDIARERGYRLDMAGYERCMTAQRERARAASTFHLVNVSSVLQAHSFVKMDVIRAKQFNGYDHDEVKATVKALFRNGAPVPSIKAGEQATVVLDHTPFYAESGGQVGDCGQLEGPAGVFKVADTRKEDNLHLHTGVLTTGTLAVDEDVTAHIDVARRTRIRANHSATHLLHAVLRQVLGNHVAQKGSLVDAERLRFDFAHPEAMTSTEIKAIERRVNTEIRRNTPVQTEEMAIADAQRKGAMALFGEKYGDQVRVLTMGDGFSVELCGGTHVVRTGDIGLLRIISESGIASGVRRIEAVTGEGALALFDEVETGLNQVAATLKTSRTAVLDKAIQLMEQNRRLSREVEALKVRLASAAGGDPLAGALNIGDGARLLVRQLDSADAKTLRELADQLRSRLGTGVVVLAGVADGKVALIAGVTGDLTARVSAGELMQFVAPQLGGKGGGRADMAQGGGTDVAALPAALDSVYGWLEQRLSA